MRIEKINTEELKYFISSAFWDDNELISLYDKNVPVKFIEDVCDNVYEKISSLTEKSSIRGVTDDEGFPIGYFAFEPQALISFGININYRNKVNLVEFWEHIKKEIGTTFSCYLFDYNVRAINWLKKCGMNILFENVTILQLCH